MSKMNIKTGDNVLVISGGDKGKISIVSATSPKTNKVCVEGVNIQTKHSKAKKANEKSEIIKKEGFIDASNVMVVCPSCNKPTRVGRKVEDGKSIRVCKKCGAVLDTDKKVSKSATKAKASTAAKKSSKSQTKSTVKKSDAKSTTKTVATRGDK